VTAASLASLASAAKLAKKSSVARAKKRLEADARATRATQWATVEVGKSIRRAWLKHTAAVAPYIGSAPPALLTGPTICHPCVLRVSM